MKRLIGAGLLLAPALVPAYWLGQASAPFADDPKAHAAYAGMVAAMRKAKSLSWTADYRCKFGGKDIGHSTYKIWLCKPNFARMEAFQAGSSTTAGTMVLDGSTIWVYWPNGKPAYQWDLVGKRADAYKQYSRKFFSKQNAPLARHSIGHVAQGLGACGIMPIFDPSTFHGYTDSLQPYVDGVRFIEGERVFGEDCLGLEVSFMKHQRSWRLWLSKKDRIPRRLEQTVRVNTDIVMTESWSNVKLNAPMSPKLFAWSPPKGWREYSMPSIEEGLLPPGTVAPDFELAGLDGGKIKLSGYRGKVVWVNKWRCG